MNKVILMGHDTHRATVHRNPCASHAIHWQSTVVEIETGSSQQISSGAWHLDEPENLLRSISRKA